jgi:RHS repeat-associated protein
VSAFDYINDSIARRTQRIDSGSAIATNAFGYNLRSELASARMGTNAYGYAYDAIGNRLAVTNNAEAFTYTANALNQYTNILRVSAPPREDIPAYDLDGNLTNYNGWTFAWDAENRLSSAEQVGTAVPAVRFAYDYMSRRVQKIVGASTNTFQYDDWSMIQETTGSQTNSYVYGLDLSGSVQGAGTIGGLLSASLNGTQAFYFYDANGNVSDLTDCNGNSLAHYEFDPYGNATVSTGSLASANPFRFSTKHQDDETGLYYYSRRFYDAETGRWLNRDPIEEDGGLLLYGFVGNNPVSSVDPNGEAIGWDCCACAAALVGKLGGTLAGCAYGCYEVKSIFYPWSTCLNECIEIQFSSAELLKQFKGNPAEWIGAAACVSCGVKSIKNLIQPCNPTQKTALQATVNLACKQSGKMACNPTQDVPTLKANMAKNLACAAAREAINATCFKGGDTGHQQAAANALKAASICAALIAAKGGSLP